MIVRVQPGGPEQVELAGPGWESMPTLFRRSNQQVVQLVFWIPAVQKWACLVGLQTGRELPGNVFEVVCSSSAP